MNTCLLFSPVYTIGRLPFAGGIFTSLYNWQVAICGVYFHQFMQLAGCHLWGVFSPVYAIGRFPFVGDIFSQFIQLASCHLWDAFSQFIQLASCHLSGILLPVFTIGRRPFVGAFSVDYPPIRRIKGIRRPIREQY